MQTDFRCVTFKLFCSKKAQGDLFILCSLLTHNCKELPPEFAGLTWGHNLSGLIGDILPHRERPTFESFILPQRGQPTFKSIILPHRGQPTSESIIQNEASTIMKRCISFIHMKRFGLRDFE